jgi:hypothetical protein
VQFDLAVQDFNRKVREGAAKNAQQIIRAAIRVS